MAKARWSRSVALVKRLVGADRTGSFTEEFRPVGVALVVPPPTTSATRPVAKAKE
jgi:hypothetical protein